MKGFFRIPERLHIACIFMTELCEASREDRRLSLKELGSRMSISDGYLEEIAASLKKAGLIQGRTGPNGGYMLAVKPKEISAKAIVEAIEGPIAIVRCHDNAECPFHGKCHSRKLWDVLQGRIQDVLEKTTLNDLL